MYGYLRSCSCLKNEFIRTDDENSMNKFVYT